MFTDKCPDCTVNGLNTRVFPLYLGLVVCVTPMGPENDSVEVLVCSFKHLISRTSFVKSISRTKIMNFQDILFLYRTKRLWPRNQRTADSKSHSQKYCEYVTHILLTDYLLQQSCTV